MSSATHVQIESTATPSGFIADARIVCPKVGEREAEIVQQELSAASEKHNWRTIVDFSAVTFLTSVGLGVLVTLLQRAKRGGGKLALYGINKELMDILKITHLDKVLTIVPNREAAIKAVS